MNRSKPRFWLSANHVIAIGIRVRANPVVAKHEHAVLGVGIAGDVEPAAPHRSPLRGDASNRSTTRANASADWSFSNARTSAMVGGSPVRSK